jgi:hypothetical protein
MPFYVLLDAALRHLPEHYRYKGRVYRGMKWCFPTPQDHSPEVLCDYFYEGREVIWFVPKSTSQDLRVMETEDFCGLVGARTIFHVQASLGFNIERFSAFAREKEIVIPMFAQMEVLHVTPLMTINKSQAHVLGSVLHTGAGPDIVAMRQLETEGRREAAPEIVETEGPEAGLEKKDAPEGPIVETPTAQEPKAGWQRAPSMPTKRGDLAAAVLDGQLYALGGSDDRCLDTVERF